MVIQSAGLGYKTNKNYDGTAQTCDRARDIIRCSTVLFYGGGGGVFSGRVSRDF